MLKRNFFKELSSTTSRLISVIIITAAAVILYVALSGVYYNIEKTTTQYFESQNVADYWISGAGLNKTDYNKIKNLNSVSQIQARIVIDAEERNNENIRLTLYGIADEFNINIPFVSEGEFPLNNREMMISSAFAKEQDLAIGDSYEMLIKGTNKIIKLQIYALINSPECMHHINSSTLAPDYSKYGFAYMNEDIFRDIMGENIYNQFCVKTTDGIKDKDFKNEVINVLGNKVTNVLKLKDNKNAYTILDQVGAVKVAIVVFPTIFFLIAALIMFSTMSRIIENSRGTIGILKALGFDDKIIQLYYLYYAGIVVMIGYLLGALPANTFLTKPVAATLFYAVDLPHYTINFDKASLIIAFILTNIFCIGTSFIITRKALHEKPAECMRPKPPKAMKKNLLERITPLRKRFNFTQKYIIRNIFRNKLRPLIFITGIAGCMVLILTSFGMNDSLNNYTNQLKNKLHRYDTVAVFARDVSEVQYNHIKIMESVQEVQYEMATGVKIYSADKKETTTISVSEDVLTIKLIDTSGPDIMEMPTQGIIMSNDLANNLNVKVGDTVNVECFNNNKIYKMKIDNIYGNINGAYIGKTYWRSIGQDFLPTAVYIKTDNVDKVAQTLSNYDFIESYKNKTDVTAAITGQLKTMSLIVFLFIVFGGTLALVVLYNLGIMNFYEETRSLATLMVLGFSGKEIKKLMLTENIIFTFIGIICGIPFGIKLVKMLMGSMGSFSMDVTVKITSYFLASIITMIFAAFINKILSNKMKTIDMLGALKSIE